MIWTGVSEKSGESYFYSVSARIRSLARAAAPRRARRGMLAMRACRLSCRVRIASLISHARLDLVVAKGLAMYLEEECIVGAPTAISLSL